MHGENHSGKRLTGDMVYLVLGLGACLTPEAQKPSQDLETGS